MHQILTGNNTVSIIACPMTASCLSPQLSTFNTGLDCDKREEFLVTFVALGLRPSVFQVDDDSTVFGVDRDLIISKNWIQRTEPVLEHRDFISSFLFRKSMKN